MNDKQLAKLIKQNQAKAAAKTSKARPARAYDSTLPKPPENDDQDIERSHMFKEMKRREF